MPGIWDLASYEVSEGTGQFFDKVRTWFLVFVHRLMLVHSSCMSWTVHRLSCRFLGSIGHSFSVYGSDTHSRRFHLRCMALAFTMTPAYWTDSYPRHSRAI